MCGGGLLSCQRGPMFPGVAERPPGAEVTPSVLSSVNPIAEGPREMGVHISKVSLTRAAI